jgi:hypothetical protein
MYTYLIVRTFIVLYVHLRLTVEVSKVRDRSSRVEIEILDKSRKISSRNFGRDQAIKLKIMVSTGTGYGLGAA